MSAGVLEILNRRTFTDAGQSLLGDLWDPEQEEYEESEKRAGEPFG